jgi:hypothetical protein
MPWWLWLGGLVSSAARPRSDCADARRKKQMKFFRKNAARGHHQ